MTASWNVGGTTGDASNAPSFESRVQSRLDHPWTGSEEVFAECANKLCNSLRLMQLPFATVWRYAAVFLLSPELIGEYSRFHVEMKVGSILCACVPAFTAVFDAPGGAIHECPLWTCRESGRFFQYGVTSSALGIAGRNAKSEPTYCAYSILIQYLEYL